MRGRGLYLKLVDKYGPKGIEPFPRMMTALRTNPPIIAHDDAGTGLKISNEKYMCPLYLKWVSLRLRAVPIPILGMLTYQKHGKHQLRI